MYGWRCQEQPSTFFPHAGVAAFVPESAVTRLGIFYCGGRCVTSAARKQQIGNTRTQHQDRCEHSRTFGPKIPSFLPSGAPGISGAFECASYDQCKPCASEQFSLVSIRCVCSKQDPAYHCCTLCIAFNGVRTSSIRSRNSRLTKLHNKQHQQRDPSIASINNIRSGATKHETDLTVKPFGFDTKEGRNKTFIAIHNCGIYTVS